MNSPIGPTPKPQVAVLTPTGRGAVATIAVWGAGTDSLTARFFHAANGKRLSDQLLRQILFGRFAGKESPASASEELVVCRRVIDDLEIHCHGGSAAVTAITDVLVTAGCELTTSSVYLAEHLADPIRSEGYAALAAARTEYAAEQLWRMIDGGLQTELNAISECESSGDFAAAEIRLTALIATWPLAKHLTQPFRVVLCGPPNVGKSSLLNALLGYDRAIVFDQPGTTRDVLSATTVLDGWVIECSDTAGLREGGDFLEQAGMELAQSQIALADLVLTVADATQGEPLPDIAGIRNKISIWNKIDLLPPGKMLPTNVLPVSAKTGEGLAQLQQTIVQQLVPISLNERPFLFTERQFNLATQRLAEIQSKHK